MTDRLLLVVVLTGVSGLLSALLWQLALNPRIFACGCLTADACCHGG
jgi:hypothetical protein